jgi:hypothetical protein
VRRLLDEHPCTMTYLGVWGWWMALIVIVEMIR